jgi:hypothetical protein
MTCEILLYAELVACAEQLLQARNTGAIFNSELRPLGARPPFYRDGLPSTK